MAEYENLTHDLPGRCLQALEAFLPVAQIRNLDVTCILMVATTGFTIPYEVLLKRDANDPSLALLRDAPDASVRLCDALSAPFVKSEFWPSGEFSLPASASKAYFESRRCSQASHHVWRKGRVTWHESGNHPHMWKQWRTGILEDDVAASTVLAVIRNALAHGNIRTVGDPVEDIVFLSAKKATDLKQGYRYVSMHPCDLLGVLLRWFDFLKEHRISELIPPEAVGGQQPYVTQP